MDVVTACWASELLEEVEVTGAKESGVPPPIPALDVLVELLGAKKVDVTVELLGTEVVMLNVEAVAAAVVAAGAVMKPVPPVKLPKDGVAVEVVVLAAGKEKPPVPVTVAVGSIDVVAAGCEVAWPRLKPTVAVGATFAAKAVWFDVPPKEKVLVAAEVVVAIGVEKLGVEAEVAVGRPN